MEIPTTTERVPKNTAEWHNRRIQREMEMRIWYFAQNPDRIDERLKELDEEWDIERTLETNAASLALAGTILGMLGARKFFLLPAVVTGFLLQHGLQGWCPPVPLFRKMGIRTQTEIEAERYALKALRGDFRKAGEEADTPRRIQRTLEVVSAPQPLEPTEGEEPRAYH